MDEFGSAQSVVPRPSSPKLLKKLEKATKVKLGQVDRNTIFIFERLDDPEQRLATHFPVALATHARTASLINRDLLLENILVLSTLMTSMDVAINIPNTTRHTYLAEHIDDHLVNFGAMDDCVFPDCTHCRRSAQCLTGGICASISVFGRFAKARILNGTSQRFAPGDRYNQWSFAVSHRIPMRTMPRKGIVMPDYDIWLHRSKKDIYTLKFTRSR
jgi:hypothetical protein